MGGEARYKTFFLIGSDYVYPRTANLILKKHIEKDGLTVLGESYVPLGAPIFRRDRQNRTGQTRDHHQHIERRFQRRLFQTDGGGRAGPQKDPGHELFHR
jgi:hypothetical protein